MIRTTLLRTLAIVCGLLGVGVFLWPVGVMIRASFDPGVNGNGIPAVAWSLHRSLAPRMEAWAKGRVDSGKAATLTTENLSGTEWPVFGSVFYLVAMENLQAEWEKHNGPGKEPRIAAREAIDAAAALVADPKHAHWVKLHWGDGYLTRENLFYRMLLISGCVAHERLTKSGRYLTVLREQVESLAKELDETKSGLLNDYPGECYHVDNVFAIRAIRHADSILGTDHSAFVERELRAFPPGELPPYFADQATGEARSPIRGCSSSPFLTHAAVLWPEHVDEWAAAYNRDFWQSLWWAVGYREFALKDDERGQMGGRFSDLDAGPVVAGFGSAASAFGIGSARATGDSSRARALTLQALAVAWPVPGGGMYIPRIVSDKQDAPLLGECGLLYALTQPAVRPLYDDGVAGVTGMVWIIGGLQAIFGVRFSWGAVVWWRRARVGRTAAK